MSVRIDVHGLLQMAAGDFIGQSVAVLGIKGSGKSNTAAVLMEQLLTAGIPIAVVDIAGEYHTLRERFDQVTVIGRGVRATTAQVALHTGNAADVAETAYLNGAPVVMDLSGVPHDAREELLFAYFGRIWQLSATVRIPLVVFLEEAHNWIPQRGRTAVSSLFTAVATEGRKNGLSLVMVTQRSARVDKDVLTQADVAFLHRVRHPIDLRVYQEMIPRPPRKVQDMVHRLKTGDALALVGEDILRIRVRERTTRHVGATPTAASIPAAQRSLFELLGNKPG